MLIIISWNRMPVFLFSNKNCDSKILFSFFLLYKKKKERGDSSSASLNGRAELSCLSYVL